MRVAQSCPTLCHPMDYTVYGILQARILEWVAVPFSSGSSQPRNWTGVSCIEMDSLPGVWRGSTNFINWVLTMHQCVLLSQKIENGNGLEVLRSWPHSRDFLKYLDSKMCCMITLKFGESSPSSDNHFQKDCRQRRGSSLSGREGISPVRKCIDHD